MLQMSGRRLATDGCRSWKRVMQERRHRSHPAAEVVRQNQAAARHPRTPVRRLRMTNTGVRARSARLWMTRLFPGGQPPRSYRAASFDEFRGILGVETDDAGQSGTR